MPRRSLKPQLNQIRAWVHQGRTDAWIAHQLEISATELREFRKQYDLSADDENAGSSEIDLRDEIEAEIEAAAAEQEDIDEEDEGEDGEEGSDEDSESDDSGSRPKRRRRRGRRGGRGRRKELEATFDHGEEDGYGLWLDASVKDNPLYTEHWAGKRDLRYIRSRVRRPSSPRPVSRIKSVLAQSMRRRARTTGSSTITLSAV